MDTRDRVVSCEGLVFEVLGEGVIVISWRVTGKREEMIIFSG